MTKSSRERTDAWLQLNVLNDWVSFQGGEGRASFFPWNWRFKVLNIRKEKQQVGWGVAETDIQEALRRRWCPLAGLPLQKSSSREYSSSPRKWSMPVWPTSSKAMIVAEGNATWSRPKCPTPTPLGCYDFFPSGLGFYLLNGLQETACMHRMSSFFYWLKR